MTFATLFNDMTILFLFLIIGCTLREVLKITQKLYIPASFLGGALVLVLGPQVLGLIEVPASFSSYSGTLLVVVIASNLLGVRITKDTIRSYADTATVFLINYGMQLALGIALALVLSLAWPGMPEGWGAMGVFSFWGGHGTASAVGGVFSSLGVEGNLDIGMLLSTVGLIAAMSIGMVYANIGIRKGWCSSISVGRDTGDDTPAPSGVLKEKFQRSLGFEKINPASVNNLAFQGAILMTAVWLGNLIVNTLKSFIPALAGLPNLVNAVVGGLLFWSIMLLTKTDGYLDKKTLNNISGTTVEVIIVGAVATLNLKLVTTYFVPLAIYCVVMIVATSVTCFLAAKKICTRDWFEKFMFVYGAGTGSVSTGIALTRAVDPRGETTGIQSGVIGIECTDPITAILPAFLPMLYLSAGPLMSIGLGSAIMVGGIIVGILLTKTKSTNN